MRSTNLKREKEQLTDRVQPPVIYSIKDCQLGESGSSALATQLSKNTSVKELELSEWGLDEVGWARLAGALQSNRSVSKLTVGGWDWKGAKAGTGPFEVRRTAVFFSGFQQKKLC